MLRDRRRLIVKARSALFAGLVGICSPVIPARSKVAGPDFWAVTGVAGHDVLALRAAPKPSAARTGVVPSDGRRLQNLGCTGVPSLAEWQRMSPKQQRVARAGRWCKVRYNGRTGWVRGKFLREDGG
ncbi:SH3 domain-containing protein [Bosea sp. 2RAB26]|uniref:SH3 domain-containing protein n=1 Tax=Bosea sp. 2RAB26 TaxID=3237476 RepID=UPI003F8DFE7B